MGDRHRRSAVHLFLMFFAFCAAATAAAQNQNITLKPSSGMAGTSVDVVARGLHIDPASITITFQPAGLTVRNVRLEARELGFTIDIAPNAPSGEYTLVITPKASTGRAAITGVPPQPLVVPNAFRVTREVRVTGINPAQITAGTTTTVTITGSGFAPKAKLIFVGTADLTSSVKNVTDSMMTATITATPNAALGAFNVIVENVDGTASHKQKPLPSITVVAPQAAPVPPVVARIAPGTAVQGSTLMLRIDGRGFKPGAVVNLGTGVGVKVVSVAPEQIVANVAVAATAPVGAHRVVVRNPDNLSNEAQPSPVDLMITAAAPPAQPPARVEPPAQPPVKVDPPKVEPPKVEPPKTPPPAQTPPKTTPPTTPPATPVPPATKPPAPPVATPPVAKPPVIPQVPMPPPPTTLQGPRVDAVQPQSLIPGVNYTLDLSGKNLAPDTKISFGNDVTVVGVPIVLSPTKAKLQVMVSPAAKPGVLAAVASGAGGKNSGPGGVMIASANKQNQPGQKATTPAAPKAAAPGTKLPIGTIKLTAPCNPMVDLLQCDDVPLLTDAVHFKWKELTPGISDVFVFEIIDAKEKVLYSAQAKSPQLAWSTTKLTALLDKKSTGASPTTGTYTGNVGTPGGTGGVQGVGPGSIPTGAPATPSQGVPHAKKLSDFEMLVKSYPNAVFWRVRGMRKKPNGRPSDLYLAAASDVRPLALPQAPAGFSCPAAAKSKIAIVPIPSGETYAAPCGQYSTNICSGMSARFSDDSTVDLSKVPFDLGQIGSIGNDGGSAAVAFYGVYVDWGDGSEPYPLVVDGDDSSSLSKAKLYASALKHTYTNKNSSDEFREYVARVYAISSDTSQSLTALAQAAAKAASTGGTQDNKNVHTLACTAVKVWNEVDATKDGPLTLLSAVTVFPDDWAKLAQYAMSGVNGTNDVNAVAIQSGGMPIPTMPGAGSAAGSKGTNSGGTPPGGGVPGGNVGALGPGAVKAPAAPGSAPTYTIDTSKITQVSECAEAFRPFVRIQYYGRGRARVRWTLDGKVIDEHETPELPPVTYSDGIGFKKTYDIQLSMPLPSKLKAGANLHTLKVHVETGKLPGSMTSAAGASKAAGMQGMTPGSSKLVHSTVPPATGGGASLAPAGGAKSSSGGNAPTGGNIGGAMTPSQGGNAAKGIGAGGAAGKVGVFDPGAGDSSEGPFSAVDANPRVYQLVAQLPGVPCRILYKTAKSGTVVISDITGFTLDAAGSSGTGKLHIPFAGEFGPASKQYGYATVSFSKWKLEPLSGDPTQFHALSGSLSGKAYAKGTVRNFPVEITAVALDPQQLLIDGTVSLPAKNISATIGAMPKWSFAKVPMASGGHFAFTSKTSTRVALGHSHFELDITEAEFDFGFMKQPASGCNKTSFGGALISGTLRAPKALTFGTKPIFSDVKVGPWAVTPQGLAVKLDELPIGTSVKEGNLTFTTSGVSLNTCDGGIAPKFALAINGVPFFTEGIHGDGSLDAYGNLLVALQPAKAAKSWSNADAKVSSLSLHREENWYFLANGSFAFRAYGKPFHTIDYEGMRLGFDGTVELPPLPVGNVAQTTVSLAGFPMTITKFTAGSKAGALHFTFTGDIKFAEHVKNATNRDVTFKLPYASASMLAAPAMQFAETSLEDGPLAMLAPPPDQGGGGEDPEVQTVDIDLAFPPGSGMVTIKATSTWTSSPQGYRFTTDNGTISVLDSFAIEKTKFVFGNDKGESYWLAQASMPLSPPIQLGTTPLYLYSIGGGLGHNIDIQSFYAPIEDIVAAHQPSTYLFNANVDVATIDKVMFWSNGGLTVKIGDGFAARADLKAWLLTENHEQPPMGVGCMQYAGGAFSAGFGMHYEAPYGGLIVDAPVGADACQAAAVHIYFGSDDWHVNLGSPTARVSAKVAGAGGSGSLAISSTGAAFDFAVHYENSVSLDIGVCTAKAGYKFDWGIGAGLEYSPFKLTAKGTAGVAVGAGCGWFDVGAGGNATLSVALPSSPQICGSLTVYVHVLGDDYNLINTGNFCL